MVISASNAERSVEIQLAILMRQLLHEHVLRVPKSLLLQLVGYQNDAAGAWPLVQEAYEDVGGRGDVYGMRLPSGEILLTVGRLNPIARLSDR